MAEDGEFFLGTWAGLAALLHADRQGLSPGVGNENKLFRNGKHGAILKLASEGTFQRQGEYLGSA